MNYEAIAEAARKLDAGNTGGLSQEECDAINAVVREIDPRMSFAVNIDQKAPWLPKEWRGVVILRAGERRFAAPYRDGKIHPFDITGAEQAMADALAAAKELQEFVRTNL